VAIVTAAALPAIPVLA